MLMPMVAKAIATVAGPKAAAMLTKQVAEGALIKKGIVTSKTIQGTVGLYFAPELAEKFTPVINLVWQGLLNREPLDVATISSLIAAITTLWAIYGRIRATS